MVRTVVRSDGATIDLDLAMAECYDDTNKCFKFRKVLSEDVGNTVTYTAAMSTNETDVSALFTDEDLTGSTRRTYSVWLDMQGFEDDANNPNVTIKVYTKIDGTNYRLFDTYTWSQGDAPGISILISDVKYDAKISMEASAAVGGDTDLNYTVFKEKFE